MRWLDELFNPALKCVRVGHKHLRCEYPVYLTTWRAIELKIVSFTYRSVAISALRVDVRCPRCGILHSTRYSAVQQLDGLSMDSIRWRELRENGEVRA